MIFRDRRDAGAQLARRLLEFKTEDVLVLGVPRGGVVVAAQVAKALDAPLDVVISRKIGAPHNEELAIGAVAADGTVILDDTLVAYLGVSDAYIKSEVDRQRKEIQRRLLQYRGRLPAPVLAGRTILVVDDGVATGMTVRAALRSLSLKDAKKVVLGLPVAPPDTVVDLAREASQIITLYTPEPFYAVGQWYSVFDQTSDEEVISILKSHTPKAARGQ